MKTTKELLGARIKEFTLEKISKALNVEIKDLFEFMHQAKSKELM